MKRIAFLLSFMVLVLAACGNGDDTTEVTITFDSMGGEAVEDITVSLPDATVNLPQPEREGHTFAGWYLSEDLIESFDPAALVDESTITLYAAWQEVSDETAATVTFDTGGAAALDPVEVTVGETLAEPDEPSRDGYVFAGWYDSPAFDTAFDFTESIDEDVTIYARWLEVFTVTFYDSDGTSLESTEVVEGETVAQPDDPTKDDFVFDTWVTDYTSETPFDFSEPIASETGIHALWVELFTVVFIVEGTTIETVEVPEGETVSLPDDPSKAHHTFVGWTVDELNLNPFEAPYTVESHLEVHANFEADTYTITFETAPADPLSDLNAQYGSVISAPALSEVDGYLFAGWYEDADFTTEFVFDTMPPEDITVYARWIEEGSINTVSFYVAGELYEQQTVYDGETVVLPSEPTKTGHTFIGWMLSGEPFDASEPIMTHLDLVAAFEANEYTITFEDDLAPAISAPYDATIEAPEAPYLEDHTFAGWYLDEDLEEPFLFDTMPLDGAHLYARFIDDNAPMSVLDVILTQPESATFEDLTLIYSEYLSDLEGGTHLAILSDGEHALFAMLDPGVALGSVVSFEANLHYEGDYPIIVHVEDFTDHGVDPDFSFDPVTVSLEDLRSQDFGPLDVGNVYEITDFMMEAEGMYAMFDITFDRFYPLFNVMFTDTHDNDFTTLDHGYITIVVTPMIRFDEESAPLIYLADAETVVSVSLSIMDKFHMIEDLLNDVYEHQSVHPFMGLEVPEQDPFFGLNISMEAKGPNAALYDAEADEFGWVDAPTIITFEVGLEDNGITYVFDLDITLEPEPTLAIMDGFTEEMGRVDVVVVAKSDFLIYIQDASGMISTYVSDPSAFTVGERYILDIQFMQKGPILTGMYANILNELGPVTWEVEPTVLDIDALYTLMETSHGAKQTELEGILMPGAGSYPFMLYGEEAVVYIQIDPDHDLYEDLAQYLFTHRVSLPGILHDFYNPTWDPDVAMGYVLYFDGDLDTITTTALSDTEIFGFVENMLSDIEMPLRPNETIELPYHIEPYDMDASYILDDSHVSIDETADYLLITFDAEATTTMQVTLTMDGNTHTFTIDLVVEDYDLSSIAYAKSLPEGTEVTLRVDVSGVQTFNSDYVLTDETGLVLLDGSTIPEWLPFESTLIITGELMSEDDITWLVNATFNEFYHEEASGTPVVDVVDPETIFAMDEIEGVTYIEIAGHLAYYNGDLSLIDEEGGDRALQLGLEGGYSDLNPFVGEDVTLRGFLIEGPFYGPMLIFAERVVTEYTGDVAGLYEEADGRRTWMDLYVLSYYDGILYLMDDTGVIEVRGIDESWAQNRIGDRADVYATLVHEEDATYLETHNFWFLNNREAADIETYAPALSDTTISDTFEIDTTEKALSKPVYRISGIVVDEAGEFYLEAGEDMIRIVDPLGLYDAWLDDVGTEQTLALIMTRNTTIDGEPVLLYLPLNTD